AARTSSAEHLGDHEAPPHAARCAGVHAVGTRATFSLKTAAAAATRASDRITGGPIAAGAGPARLVCTRADRSRHGGSADVAAGVDRPVDRYRRPCDKERWIETHHAD